MDTSKKKRKTRPLYMSALAAVIAMASVALGGEEGNAPSISAARAMEIAKQAAGSGEAMQAKLKRKRYGGSAYQFVIIDENERITVEVDGDTGEVLKNDRRSVDQERVGRKNRDSNAGEAESISSESAKEIAIAKVGGGTVTSSNKEFLKGGKVVFTVTIIHDGQMYTVKIDGVTGQVASAHGQRRGPRKGREYLNEPLLPSELPVEVAEPAEEDDDGE